MKVLLKILILQIICLLFVFNKATAQDGCGFEVSPEQADYIYDTHQEFDNLGFDLSNFEQTTFLCVAHIIRDEFGNGGLSNEDLMLSFKQLNTQFENVEFAFEICDINFIDDKEQFEKVDGKLLNYAYENTINIYFAPNLGGYCGWATLPSSNNDWIAMDNDCATNGSTLAHELGHYFSLYHTHRGKKEKFTNEWVSREAGKKNCDQKGVGDELCGTPAEPNYNGKTNSNGGKLQGQSGCVNDSCINKCGGKDSKGELYKPDTHNIMSYSKSTCRSSFTDDQIARMQQSAIMHRSYLTNSCTPKFVHAEDSLTLLTFYHATNGQNWDNKWDLTKPVSKWNGVRLNNKGRVISLAFGDNNLDGYIPDEIGNLSALETLSIWGNPSLKGKIPLTIGQLSKLKFLGINATGISGAIPIEISNLVNLEHMRIWLNKKLKGTIPPQIKNLKKLESLQFQHSGLSGNFPPELASLPKLKTLTMSGLNGCYEPSLKVLCDQVSRLNHGISSMCKFDADWTDFCDSGAGMCVCNRKADSLSLVAVYNALDGLNWTPKDKKWNLNQPVDKWPGITLNEGGCVETIYLNNTTVNGMLPPEIGNLYYLKALVTGTKGGSSVSGKIPDEIGSLYNLEKLALPNGQEVDNQISALEREIPKSIANLSRLKYLQSTGDSFKGSFPVEVGYLKNLEVLNITNNNYSGEIPAEIACLTKLEYLDLSRNQLSGCFKPELSVLCDQLKNAQLEYNNFDATWEDFCNFGAGTCNSTFKNGDFNNDGTVNHIDALYLGLAYGNTGDECEERTVDIDNCGDWAVDVNGINGKYQDADGNGLVDAADLGALEANYSFNANNSASLKTSKNEFTLASVQVDGKTIKLDLHLEAANNQNTEMHGIACSVDLSEFNISSVEVDFSKSCIVPDITFYKLNPKTNILDIVVSRNDKINQSCDGTVANIVIISVDELEVDGGNQVSLFNGNIINADGVHMVADGNTYDLGQQGLTKLAYNDPNDFGHIIQNYPNPFKEATTITYMLPETYQQAFIKVYDITGKIIKSVALIDSKQGSVNLTSKDIQPGIYLYTLEVDGEAISTKKMKMYQ